MTVVKVEDLSKAYVSFPSEWYRFASWFGVRLKVYKENWVLRDINFELAKGEAIGIIGHNGAGKSTLLKIVAGTLKPSKGLVHLHGNISAILELGMGFDPELTGRQNVWQAASLMGKSSIEIREALSSIEDFTEIGEYFDQPVRVYSSGMQMRLAFSVASAWRPEILIVDEALSVGDIQFQQKCFERIRELRDSGTTLLFVTHDLGSLADICEKAILINNGQQVFYGDVKNAIEHYFTLSGKEKIDAEQPDNELSSPSEQSMKSENNLEESAGSNQYVLEFQFFDANKKAVEFLTQGEYFFLEIRLNNLSRFIDPHVGFRIQDRRGSIVYETNTFCLDENFSLETLNGVEHLVTFRMQANMSWGEYTLSIGIENEASEGGVFRNVIMHTQLIAAFTVVKKDSKNRWSGQSDLKARLQN